MELTNRLGPISDLLTGQVAVTLGWLCTMLPGQKSQEQESGETFIHSTNIYPAPTACQLYMNKTNKNLPLCSVDAVGGD